MRYLLFFVAALATASAQVPKFIYGITAPIVDAPGSVIDPINDDVDQDESLLARSPLLYSSDFADEENQEEPGFYLQNDQANQYSSFAIDPPVVNAVAPPAFIEGHVPLAVSQVLSQYQNQYVDGRYDFGYTGGPNSRTETRDADGNVRGTYLYVDAYGNVQNRRYVADEHGFRAVGSDIPKATFELEDTPEVKEAKEALRKAYEQAHARVRRSTRPWFYYRAR